MKEMTAHDRFLERQRIANERSIEMGYGKAVEDAIVGGTGITKDGKRIDPASIYAEPKIGCVNHDCDQCKAVQEPVAKVDANDEGYWADILPDRTVKVGQLLYTAPQPVPVKTYHDGKPWPVAPKPWVGLTLEDKRYLNEALNLQGRFPVIEAIEAKLKEKNTWAAKN
jgi:hypothetical protein